MAATTPEQNVVQNSLTVSAAEETTPSGKAIDFDHGTYRRDLETLLKYAYDEYRHIGLERQRSQLTFIRHYLWTAALIFGADIQLFWFLKDAIPSVVWLSLPPLWLFYIASIASVASACIVLCLGIDTLRGRELTQFPFGKFMDHAQTAHECACTGNCRPTMLTTILSSIDIANEQHAGRIHTVGIKLRWMSRLLLLSLGSEIIAVLARVNIP